MNHIIMLFAYFGYLGFLAFTLWVAMQGWPVLGTFAFLMGLFLAPEITAIKSSEKS